MATKYISYYPNTLEGQALLDNFVRTRRILRYRDNDRIVEHIKRGMPLYEVESLEKRGANEKHNLMMHGECLSTCAYLKEQGIEVDLVYIDPPFASGADYAKKIYIRRNPLVQKVMKEAEQNLDNEEMKEFEEKMYGDIWDKERYLNWMYENLMAIKSVMSENASIYVHLDYHIGHYVKILMDEIFGEENFLSEITWKKRMLIILRQRDLLKLVIISIIMRKMLNNISLIRNIQRYHKLNWLDIRKIRMVVIILVKI